MEPRPTKLTNEMSMAAAQKVAETLIERGLMDGSTAEEIAQDIAEEGSRRIINFEEAVLHADG